MTGDDEQPPKSASPQGLFSSGKPSVQPEPRRRLSSNSIPRGLIPPSAAPEGPVLDDIAANESLRQAREAPPDEAVDGWARSVGASSTPPPSAGTSTVPPPRSGEVERLRELSAHRISEIPLEVDGGGALDLVDHSRPSAELDLAGEMQDCYALDDLTGALRFAELILGRDPDNGEARHIADDCRVRLQGLYSSKIGELDRVVEVALDAKELRWLGLDHRSGFLLSRVDGVSTVEELLDICGMPKLEALKTLAELVERGALRFR